MSDLFYSAVRGFGRRVFRSASDIFVLHQERADLAGGYLLAANHHSIYDAPILIATTPRYVDWLSIVELFRETPQRLFMSGMNCMALDRSRKDVFTARTIVRRLKEGRVVGLFPEAGLRKVDESVLQGGRFASGVVKLATLGKAPIIPVVVLGAGQYYKTKAWLPLRKTFVAVIYGEPIRLNQAGNDGSPLIEASLSAAFRSLFLEMQAHPYYQQHARGDWWTSNFPSVEA